MKRFLALIVSIAVSASGCATTTAGQAARLPAPGDGTTTMAEYAQRIPVGSRVRVEVADGRKVRGTLMKADAGSVVVSPATRVPEAPLEVPMGDVRRIELDQSMNVGKAIAIGAATGVAATFGILFLLFAMVDD
jgi:hypothetical protein